MGADIDIPSMTSACLAPPIPPACLCPPGQPIFLTTPSSRLSTPTCLSSHGEPILGILTLLSMHMSSVMHNQRSSPSPADEGGTGGEGGIAMHMSSVLHSQRSSPSPAGQRGEGGDEGEGGDAKANCTHKGREFMLTAVKYDSRLEVWP